jgi:hypothetical protein
MYPHKGLIRLRDATLKAGVHKWLMGLFGDPIVITLTKNSHLTKTQLETFLIDILAEKISGKTIKYEKKAKLRLVKPGVSRGSFNRTLSQARKNIIKSLYTVILLGYLGIFEDPSLDPYVEIANKIRTYTEGYKDAWQSRRERNEHLRIITMLQNEIEKGLNELSTTKTMSERK